jgi:replicative superfamily II helicase
MSYKETLGDGFFLSKDADESKLAAIAGQFKESTLQQVVMAGIGYVHEGSAENDWENILKLFKDGSIRVLVCPLNLCWKPL